MTRADLRATTMQVTLPAKPAIYLRSYCWDCRREITGVNHGSENEDLCEYCANDRYYASEGNRRD